MTQRLDIWGAHLCTLTLIYAAPEMSAPSCQLFRVQVCMLRSFAKMTSSCTFALCGWGDLAGLVPRSVCGMGMRLDQFVLYV